MKKMKKFSLKVVSTLAFVMLGMWSLATFAVTTTPWFGVNATNNAGITWINASTDQGGNLIDVIKSFINWMLGMLALIALVVLLFGGFQMVTAAGDETKYKKGFKILQQAAIGLVFIGVSRLLVSAIFWLLGVLNATGA